MATDERATRHLLRSDSRRARERLGARVKPVTIQRDDPNRAMSDRGTMSRVRVNA